jgi:hypothetical protein
MIDSVALASNVLIPDRDPPCGFTGMFVFRNRAHFYGGYRLAITGGASATNGSAVVTLSAGYTTDEWMIGAKVFIAAGGSTSVRPYAVRRILTTTTLELVSNWADASVSSGNAVILTDPNKIVFSYQTFGDVEMANVFYEIDVAPNDGDLLMHCAVVRDRVICLKKRAVYLLAMAEVVDEADSTPPQVNYRALSLGCEQGCVGPRAAVQDAMGNLYWFAGDGGVWRYDGGRAMEISGAVRDYPRRLDTELLYYAVMMFEPNNNEIVVGNLTFDDGSQDKIALAVDLDTGAWREMADLDLSAWATVQVQG